MDKAAEVYETSGLRGALSVSTMDEEGLPASIAMTAEEAIEKTVAWSKEYLEGADMLEVMDRQIREFFA